MDALSVAAASGIRARMESLEMLANNIANQSAPGYKSDREFYSLYLAPEALEASRGGTALMPPMLPVIERHWTDLSQGALTSTGSPLDVALSGSGFFVVTGPSGPLYTRNGNFRLSPQGDLETQEGYPVLDQSLGKSPRTAQSARKARWPESSAWCSWTGRRFWRNTRGPISGSRTPRSSRSRQPRPRCTKGSSRVRISPPVRRRFSPPCAA